MKQSERNIMNERTQSYDVAAYIWPSYTGDEPRTRMFWPEGNGEWETVRKATAKYPGHAWPRRPLWGYCNEADPYVMEMQIIPDMVKEWDLMDKTYDIPYFPHVSIGWDNNPRFQTFRPGVVKNNTPEQFRKALELARDYADRHPGQPPLITINSWNEWTETSYLQPDDLYGYGYLEAVKAVLRESRIYDLRDTD
jgi:hypothetical protein